MGRQRSYRVGSLETTKGEVSVWLDPIAADPNGLAFSLDGSVLYVAQIFKQLDPIVGVAGAPLHR